MAVTIAIVGGRPAIITAATGAVALVVAPLVKSHGLDYLIAAVILAGGAPAPPRSTRRSTTHALHRAQRHGRFR